MPQRAIHFILIFFALASSTAALAQSQPPTVAPAIPGNTLQVTPSAVTPKDKLFIVRVDEPNHTWGDAQSAFASKHKLAVVTFDQPNRWRACRVHLFSANKLVCSGAFGSLRTYLPEQVLALILPGDDALRLRLVIGFNAGLGAAIWGTVVLVATCPACAAATALAAYFFFAAAGATLIGDGQPDRFLYLAPGQQRTGKLRHVQP